MDEELLHRTMKFEIRQNWMGLFRYFTDEV